MNDMFCVGDKVFGQMVEVLKKYEGYKFPVMDDKGWIWYQGEKNV